MNSKKHIFIVAFFGLVLPSLSLAANYIPLVGIPGVTDPGLNFGNYINALYALSISVAALLAVIKIVIAGMKYMLSDVVTSKSEAISDIQGSVFGLIIVISAVLILTVINPNLTKTEIFIDTVVNTPNPPDAPGVGTITDMGSYYYAKAGTVPTFAADCKAVAGSIPQRAGTLDVCHKPLPAGVIANLDVTFNAATDADTGALYYPAANREAVLKRFQTSHYHRMIADTTDIKDDKGASEVLLGISLSDETDWLDKANSSGLVATCDELQRATGKNVKYTTGGTLGAGDAYIACVVY